MKPWLRVLAAFGIAVAAALFLRVLPPLIVLIFLVGGVAALNIGLKRKVRSQRAEFGSAAIVLKRESEDPFGLTGYPFALFSRCEGASVEDVRWGTWRGLEVKRFDLASPTSSGDAVRFACAIGPSAPAIVPLIVEAAVWRTLLDDPPFEAVDVGAVETERTYDVRCDDPAFARALAGPALLRWLAELDAPWGFEMRGSLALVYGLPSSVEEPLERLQAFTELAMSTLAAAGTQASPTRPDASSADAVGLGERSEAS